MIIVLANFNSRYLMIHRFFFFLLLLFLPTQLGLHFWPDWAMVLGRRVDYLAPTIFFSDLLVLFTLGLWVTPLFVRRLRGMSNFQFPISKKNCISLLSGGLFIFWNIFFATNHFVAIYKWIKVLEFVLLGWYIVKTKVQLSAICLPLAAGMLYSSIISIVQFLLQHSVGGPLWFLGERTFTVDTPGIARIDLCWRELKFASTYLPHGCPEVLRPYATFPHPNVLGGYLAALLPLIIIQLSNCPIIQLSNLNKQKIFYFITLVFGIIALVLTFSRSAIVVGVVAIVLTIASRKHQVASSKGVFVIVGIFLLATFYLLLSTNSSSESVVVRQQLNRVAIEQFRQSPLFGVGLGNFLVNLPEMLPQKSVYFLQPVHNIYLLLLSEVGVVSLLGFLWLAFLILNNFKFQISIFNFSLFVLLLLGLVDHYPATLQQGQLLFTIVLSLCLASVTRKIVS